MSKITNNNGTDPLNPADQTLPPDTEARLFQLQEIAQTFESVWPHSPLCGCKVCTILETHSQPFRDAAIKYLQTGELPNLPEPRPPLDPAPKVQPPPPEVETQHEMMDETPTNITSEAEPPKYSALPIDFSDTQPLSAPAQLLDEPNDCYDAFLEFCQMKKDRSIGGLASELDISRQTLYRYKKTYRWDERLRELKQRQLAVSTAAIEPILKESAITWATSMKELKALQWNLAKLQFQRAFAVFSDASTECSVKDAALLVQVGSKMGQLAVGEASDVLEDTGLTQFEQLVHEFAAKQKQAAAKSQLPID